MKIAIVTGASSGVGREFVRQIDRRETYDEIWVIARRHEYLEALQKEVGTRLRLLSYDLTNPKTFDALSIMMDEIQPDIRLLVNAAGTGKIGRYNDIHIQSEIATIDVNCRAMVWMSRLCLPYMTVGARIIQMGSTAGFQPFPFFNVYAATKAFVYRYSRALRIEAAAQGVEVTVVCPYWINDTEFIDKAQHTLNSRYIRSFPLGSKKDDVVRRALNASEKHKSVCTPDVLSTLHRAAGKIVPTVCLIGMWQVLRRVP